MISWNTNFAQTYFWQAHKKKESSQCLSTLRITNNKHHTINYNNNQRAILHQNNNEPHLKMTNIDGTTEPSQLNQEKRRKLNNTTHLQQHSNKLEIKHPLFTSKHINFTNKTKPTLTNSIKDTRTLLRQPRKNQQHQKPSKRNALF